MNRRLATVTAVLLMHIALLWALQSGLIRRAVEVVIPVEVLSEFMATEPAKASTPPAAKPAQRPPEPQVHPQPAPVAQSIAPVQAAPAAPAPVSAPTATVEAPVVSAAPAAAPSPPAPPRIELPSSDAAYLNNPKPAYPALSRRLGEQGKVVVRVLIGVDGRAQQVEIRSSSGYDRLDQAALATVRSWRYVPGTRNGIAEAMWFNVPINFILE